ncbi:MAG: SH3 domain-containing protein [Deltaproteobacteria bacterium]|nr:SH3 domain-containing protein [Deltaproteobacteria bacterium]
MTLQRTFLGLALAMLALAAIFGCAEPPPAPPPVVVEPPPPPSAPPLYFVTVSSLALREGPTTAARIITTLNFNDEVELMESAGGWGRVRDLRRNVVGWASLRYLQPGPSSRPQPVPARRRPPAAAPEKPTSPKAM